MADQRGYDVEHLVLEHRFDHAWEGYRHMRVGPGGRAVAFYVPVALPGYQPLVVEVGQDDAEYGVDAFECTLLWAG